MVPFWNRLADDQARKMVLLKFSLFNLLQLFSLLSISDAESLNEILYQQPFKHYSSSLEPYYADRSYLMPFYQYLNPSAIEYENKASLIRGMYSSSTAQNQKPQVRLLGLNSLINSALFNNRFSGANRPLSNLIGRLPITPNPEQASSLSPFNSCSGTSGEEGLCAPLSYCSVFGGRPSGTCPLGNVCCINTVSRCGSVITLNNTYWQSPFTSDGTLSCSVNIRLDQSLKEQKFPICQLRLDFVSFTISQPDVETVCATDTFQVAGALNNVPVICGDNDGQHMYIDVPNSGLNPSDVQAMFRFRAGAGSLPSRTWKIKIAMLPCGASYLAPQGCLQYFTELSGSVRSFNWRDTIPAVRQLANQNYKICFRTEVVNSGQRGNTFCMSQCTTANPNIAFSVSGNAPRSQNNNLRQCLNDFVALVGGFDPDPAAPAPNFRDRFCGGALNVNNNQLVAATVCTTVRPFQLFYRTNGDETTTPFLDGTAAAPANNMGFCLNFQQNP